MTTQAISQVKSLHVVAPAPFGGLERVVLDLTTGLAEAGHPTTIVATLSPNGQEPEFLTEAERRGVGVRVARMRSWNLIGETDQIVRHISAIQPDIVHTHGHRSDVLGLVAAKKSHLPVVATLHGFIRTTLKLRLTEWVHTQFLKRSDGIVAVSHRIGDELISLGVSPNRVNVLPNGLSPNGPPLFSRAEACTRLGIDPAKQNLCWIGRMSEEKNPILALEAIAAVESPNSVLHFLGEGPMRQRLERVTSERSLGSRVSFHGAVAEAARYLRAFDLLLLTSRTEGTPMVLLESVRAALPFVATAVGGVPDLVGDNAVLLADPSPVSFGNSIRQFEDDPTPFMTAMKALGSRHDGLAFQGWLEGHLVLYRRVAGH